MTDDGSAVLRSAFPATLAADVDRVHAALPPSRWHLDQTRSVQVDGERLAIPYRIYRDPPADDRVAQLSPTQLLILRCLLSRHHDGWVRQRNVGAVSGSTLPWVIPYLVLPLGEYVLEIVLALGPRLADVDEPGSPRRAAFSRFAADNPSFCELTRQRATSYWNEYYRHQYPRQRDYPALIMLESLCGPPSG